MLLSVVVNESLQDYNFAPYRCSIERPGLLARETRTRKFVTRVEFMLNSAAIARPIRVSEMYRDPCRVDDAGPKVVQFLDRVRDQNANSTSPLNRFIEGWAQTDLEKILDATAPSYRFTDPFVGSFDGRSLHKYFDLLEDRLSCTGAISRRELAFFLQGPISSSPRRITRVRSKSSASTPRRWHLAKLHKFTPLQP